MDLYYSPMSPSCWSVLMLSRQMNLKLNLKQLESIGSGEREAFQKLTPQHQIPTLVDGGFALGESRTIMSYLVEAHGEPADQQLYPKDPKARAAVQFLLDFDLGILYRRTYDYLSPMWRKKITRANLSKDDCQKVQEALGFLEVFLEKSRYAAGDQLTIADVSLMASISLLVICKFEGMDKYPKVLAWYETCKKDLVGYKDVIENNQESVRKFIEGQQKN